MKRAEDACRNMVELSWNRARTDSSCNRAAHSSASPHALGGGGVSQVRDPAAAPIDTPSSQSRQLPKLSCSFVRTTASSCMYCRPSRLPSPSLREFSESIGEFPHRASTRFGEGWRFE